MLKIIVNGRLGKDAEVRTIASGDMAISFTVAHSSKYNDVETTTWVKCTKWVKKDGSTKVAEYLKKGTQVLIEGTPSASAWTQADNSARAELECRVMTLELMGSPKDNPATQQQPAAQVQPAQDFSTKVSDDLPF